MTTKRQDRFIKRLNALAKGIKPEAFMAEGELNCVTYVLVIGHEDVLYVGEGLPHRATARFERQGFNDPELDFIIEQFYGDPSLRVYYAASNITKAVAVELERILIDEFDPPYNKRPGSSIWAYMRRRPDDDDTFSRMRSAEKIDYQFRPESPKLTHVAVWRQYGRKVPGQREREWEEFQPDDIITRRSPREKESKQPHELAHYNCYPKEVGATTTIAEHRARAAQAHPKLKSWNCVKSILHWDRNYIDAEGPIISIDPRPTTGK